VLLVAVEERVFSLLGSEELNAGETLALPTLSGGRSDFGEDFLEGWVGAKFVEGGIDA
jgi:hypothetical protein